MSIINARIPDDLNKSLSLIAKAAERSKSYIIYKAIENYVRMELEDQENADIALERRNQPNKKLYSSDDVQKALKVRVREI